jgi:hypothetical protein
MPPAPVRKPYQIPSVLRDLVLVDMLELTGSTVAAARLLNLSQPSVSRRYRRLALELGLYRKSQGEPGQRFSDAEWMPLLRQGVNRHRLACGVLRLGGPAGAEQLFGSTAWTEWIPLPPGSLAHAVELLEHELLDGVVLDERHWGVCSGTERPSLHLVGPDGAAMKLLLRPDPLVLAVLKVHLTSARP